ncbi:MAG TPA: hypothetical protein VHQ65_05655 [Thermoanaerobaculia bacterium]|nr:hypothetical protein [Thermoanaerobaculia bacterium]
MLGVGAGAALMTGDSGHIPHWLLPPLLGIAGAAGGLLASLLLLAAWRWIAPTKRIRLWPARIAATAAGAVSMSLLAGPLGILLPAAALAGAAAGMISSLLSGLRRSGS